MRPEATRKRPHRPSEQSGFALVIVLWVLAGLAVIAAAIAGSAGNSARSVKLLRDRVAAEGAFISASSRIAIIAATAAPQRFSLDSSRGRLFVDGRMTQVSPQHVVFLQDNRGLLNLNRPDAVRFPKLLLMCGANQTQVDSLIDALADYVDGDKLKRINGAEAFEYRAAGLPEPRNAPLLSREELWRVFGFAAIKQAWLEADCDRLVTVHGRVALNRNTSPFKLLLGDGLSEVAAQAFIEAREQGLANLELQTQGNDPSNPYNFMSAGYAGNTLRVRQQMDSIQWVAEYELELTPLRNGGPWRIHELRTPERHSPKSKLGAILPAVDYRVPKQEQLNAAPRTPFTN